MQHVCFSPSSGSSDEGLTGLGSPSDPCLSPLAWSLTGKHLACAMEKMVNIWQVNGEPTTSPISTHGPLGVASGPLVARGPHFENCCAPGSWSWSELTTGCWWVTAVPDSSGGRGLLDVQPHWVSALAWPSEEAETLWCGEPKELLLVGRMDGSLGLIEVLDSSSLQRTELEHCYRKDGRRGRRGGGLVL